MPEMATKRPGYARSTTEGARVSLEDVSTAPVQPETEKVLDEKDLKNEADISTDSVPSYGEVVGETVESSAKVLETANDLVTQVLIVEDDPSINPWTFRMVFLGMSRQSWILPDILGPGELIVFTRHRFVHFWLRASGDFLLQATDYLCFSSLLDRHCICPGRRHGSSYTASRTDWTFLEPRAI